MHEKLIYSYVYSSVYSYISSLTDEDTLIYLINTINFSESLSSSICMMPFWIYESMHNTQNKHMSPSDISELTHLAFAYMLGWISYTIYDYIRDDKISNTTLTKLLSIANICSQQSLTMCMKKACGDKHLERLIQETYTTVDMYYTYHIKKDLGTYTDVFIEKCNHIYKKSIGVAVVPMIVYCIFRKDTTTEEYKKLFAFFKHYLTARQLSDDFDDISIDTTLDIDTPATYLIKALYSEEYIRIRMRGEIGMHMRKALEALHSISDFDAQLFQERFVRAC